MKKLRHKRGDRKHNRKRHPHPLLVRPVKRVIDGREMEVDNDNGEIIRGRAYVYHHTKGWRNIKAERSSNNLTRFICEYFVRRA